MTKDLMDTGTGDVLAPDRLALAEQVRELCVEAALAGYEDAALSGLCDEGRLEAAISAIRRLDLAVELKR